MNQIDRLTSFHVVEHLMDNESGQQKSLVLNTSNSKMYSMDTESYLQILDGNLTSLSNEQYRDLVSNDFLTKDSIEQERPKIVCENLSASSDTSTLFIVLQPSSWCQLGCYYCGQSHNKNNSLNIERTMKFIQKMIERHQPKELSISWFGSEPTLSFKSILEISKKIKQLCLPRAITFTSRMTTNGLVLNKKYFNCLVHEANCRFFEITIDGLAANHNKNRPTKTGKATYSAIISNLREILSTNSSDVRVNVRCNVDLSNKNDMIPLLHELHNFGILCSIHSIYLAPIHSWGNDAHLNALEETEFANLEIDFFIEKIKFGLPVTLIPKRKRNLCLTTMASGYLVDPSGDIYKCSEVSLVNTYFQNGVNIHKLGNIDDPDQLTQNKFDKFYESVLNDTFPCGHCEMLPICGGRCPKEWSEGRIPCPSVKMNIKQRMILQSLLPQLPPPNTSQFSNRN